MYVRHEEGSAGGSIGRAGSSMCRCMSLEKACVHMWVGRWVCMYMHNSGGLVRLSNPPENLLNPAGAAVGVGPARRGMSLSKGYTVCGRRAWA